MRIEKNEQKNAKAGYGELSIDIKKNESKEGTNPSEDRQDEK